MSKHNSPMRLNKNLVVEAQVIGNTMRRSAAEQIEFWSELGKHVSNALNAQQVTKLLSGSGTLTFNEAEQKPADVFEIGEEVTAQYKTGKLAVELLDKGNVLYEPSPEGGDMLVAHYPNGEVKTGRFQNGRFKAVRKTSL